jgi:triphosphoribosyl-dephospho-CoA synthase CitG
MSIPTNFIEKIDFCASRAKEAMIEEVMLTPKPGLVDQNNNGSHDDMNIKTFFKSIDAIEKFLKPFVQTGVMYCITSTKCFNELRNIGCNCEEAMFKATKGVNTHKGMIFSLAVILGAHGQLLGQHKKTSPKNLHEQIKKLCHGLVQKDLTSVSNNPTSGEEFYLACKDGGIRQEAQNGYPTLFYHSLPTYKKYLQFGKKTALHVSLIVLMQNLQDSTLWARDKKSGLKYVQNYAKSFRFDPKGVEPFLKQMDEALILRNLSPGGSADLLAMTYLVHELTL